MRSIRKRGSGPYQLARSHCSPPTTSDISTSRWSSFGYKAQVLSCLLEEQYGLCCYSEIRPDRVGLSFHIEHVENKSQHPQCTFDYNNLAACALDSQSDLEMLKIQGAEIFGGHASGKSTWLASSLVTCPTVRASSSICLTAEWCLLTGYHWMILTALDTPSTC